MSNTARTTTVPAAFRQSGAPVTPPAAEPTTASPTATADLYAMWQGMTIGETAAAPLPKLLTLLGVTVEEVEPEELPIGIHATFHGQIGDADIKLSRSLPQDEREPIVREFLNTITPEPATRAKGPASYRVTKQITGTIQCFDWCSEPHHEHTGNIENIVHQSSRITLELPTENGPMALLYAHIAVDPFAVDVVQREPHIVIDDEQSLYFLPLMQSVEFSDEMFEFAAALREMTSKAAGK
ncbi:hypothetical protein GTY66_23555 [Streptomyces sp. SID8356]|uniref:DUF6907 domain-containing protein n=1 Tax=unclassified Streptomyces TaxID=2593676 RepID=UPI0003725F41|nr:MULTISPECIES: hypothetical protein [unclassified Streptomyces]MYT38990.1 hypothetical protein [Streptomyces sp. SID8356]